MVDNRVGRAREMGVCINYAKANSIEVDTFRT
jgi:hypothetical protein